MKVAEQFQTLEILHQNRIDLGLGRAIGGHQKVASRLSFDRELIPLDAYEAMICELLDYFNEKKLYSDPANGMLVQPILETFPAIWILGSSNESAFIAAKYGLPFCFAEFLNPLSGEEILEIYRNNFRDSVPNAEPQATVALSALCADSRLSAENIAWSRYCWQFRRGKIPSIEEARIFQYSDAEIDYVNYLKAVDVLGSVADVGEKLRARAERYAVDEFFLLTTTYDFSDRIRSYELIAEEFQLLGASK
jgi:luciferase family oxidoreductase group 1